MRNPGYGRADTIVIVIDRLPHIARYIWGGFTCVGGLRRIPLLCVLRHT